MMRRKPQFSTNSLILLRLRATNALREIEGAIYAICGLYLAILLNP
jgi:hypothetical protein